MINVIVFLFFCFFFPDGKIATSPKQERVEKTEEEETQIYEEWKRKILENALKAKAVDSWRF